MTTPTHIITGAAIGAVFAKQTSIDPTIIISASILINLAPDFNMLWVKEIHKHHRDFTHYPLFWITVKLIFSIIEFLLTGKLFWSSLLTANIVSHLLLDTVGVTIGVHWLWPFSTREFSATQLTKVRYKNFKEFWQLYKNTLASKIELLWFICAGVFLLVNL